MGKEKNKDEWEVAYRACHGAADSSPAGMDWTNG